MGAMLRLATNSEPLESVLDTLTTLRNQVAALRFPLEASGVMEARGVQSELVGQLDDYVVPRLRQMDAPLLAVVGGSTGAGKSTSVNSLAESEITQTSVLRPTTRMPVLVCHPQDEPWFGDQRVLSNLRRVKEAHYEPGTVHMAQSSALPPGLALLDTPDIDSVSAENRELAAQLLAAGDLWLFVTTAARYADAVPWELLRTAAQRSTAIAVVLNRVPPEAIHEVSTHLSSMLVENGLSEAPLFVIPEIPLRNGLLPSGAIKIVREWMRGLAEDEQMRTAIIRRTLHGVLDSLWVRVPILSEAVNSQHRAIEQLRSDIETAYEVALREIQEGMREAWPLRGEALVQWQEFVGTEEPPREGSAHLGRIRERLGTFISSRPQSGARLRSVLENRMTSLICVSADRAAQRAVASWQVEPAGAALLRAGGDDSLTAGRSSSTLPDSAGQTVRSWQRYVAELVEELMKEHGPILRLRARFGPSRVREVALLLMIGVFAHPGGSPMGTTDTVVDELPAASQKSLETVFSARSVRHLAAQADQELRSRLEKILATEAARYLALLDAIEIRTQAAAELHNAQLAVQRARP